MMLLSSPAGVVIFVIIAAFACFATRGGRKPIYPGRGLTELVGEGLGVLAKGVLEGAVENVVLLRAWLRRRRTSR
jgi:hypothetical protein